MLSLHFLIDLSYQSLRFLSFDDIKLVISQHLPNLNHVDLFLDKRLLVFGPDRSERGVLIEQKPPNFSVFFEIGFRIFSV